MEHLKVLVVHRQEVKLAEIKTILEEIHSYTRLYLCGLDGLLAARIEKFDLIICTIDLPLITGFEMVRALRNYSPNRTTPVIFIEDGSEGPDHVLLSEQLQATWMSMEELRMEWVKEF